jgi:hypothetical protein
MLNFCGIVATILKMVTGRNFSMLGINSGHHYLPTYQILMISSNVEFLPPIFYIVFWQPFWKWQTSRKFWKCRIAPLMVTYHYVKFYVSIIIIKSPKQSLRDLLFLLRFLLLFLLLLFLFFLSAKHELVHGRSQEIQDRISWNLVEL